MRADRFGGRCRQQQVLHGRKGTMPAEGELRNWAIHAVLAFQSATRPG